ncbi:protein kinase [Embleya sp. NPDC008237]|uniref:serine/threonine-protein kinase n=1 Tax=Embleya sp. NPDC008237 TaxID=3363978 RepID=UPI0036EF0256
MFFREARTAGTLHHSGVVTVHDLGQDEADGSPFLVMEFLQGRDLASVLRSDGAVSVGAAVEWTAQVASALARAHAAGVVHRDLKPANLMLTDDGDVKILDFGIARFTESTNRSSMVMGTLAYMPPERFHEQPGDARSDLYSLGCVLHELLTGNVPFDVSGPVATMNAHLRRIPTRPGEHRSDVPAALDDLVLALLAKDPRDRPATADDVRRRLRALTIPAPSTATPGTRADEPPPTARLAAPARPFPAEDAIPRTPTHPPPSDRSRAPRPGTRPPSSPASDLPRTKRTSSDPAPPGARHCGRAVAGSCGSPPAPQPR